MRLYRGKIRQITSEIVEKLIADGDIEVIERYAFEVKLDLEAIMESYLREEAVVLSKARALSRESGGKMGLSKLKQMVAEDMDFRMGEDGVDWVLEQILQSFMINSHVEEVFAEDNIMRKKMIDIFRKHLDVEEAIDEEVRQKIKHVKEGTQAWEIEYSKVRQMVEKKRGLL